MVMDLKSIVSELAPNEGLTKTGIDGLELFRMEKPSGRTASVSIPAICFIVQGSKSLFIGKKDIVYDENNYLIGTAKIPLESELIAASPERPYFGVIIHIDQIIINDLLLEMDEFSLWPEHNKTDLIITSSALDNDVKESLARLLNIVGDPEKTKVLGRGLLREVYYYILKGERGYLLRNSALNHARAHKMVPIINFIQSHFKEPIDIKQIATYAGMSTSGLHEQFKRATSLSPMQFIKKIRLHNAHGLLLEGKSASDAAFDSGYGSQSQFSREFKRLFGINPSELKKTA